jgi:hypothetical protein
MDCDAKMHLDAAYSQGMAVEIEPPLMLCGDGAPEAAALLEARGEAFHLAQATPEALAFEIALAGAAQIASGEVPSLLEVQPLYLAPRMPSAIWPAKTAVFWPRESRRRFKALHGTGSRLLS